VVSNAIDLRSIVVLIRRAEGSQSGKDVLRRREASGLRVNQRVIYQVHRSLQSLIKARYIYSLCSQTSAMVHAKKSSSREVMKSARKVRVKDGIGVKR
jgi:hypothetical protein